MINEIISFFDAFKIHEEIYIGVGIIYIYTHIPALIFSCIIYEISTIKIFRIRKVILRNMNIFFILLGYPILFGFFGCNAIPEKYYFTFMFIIMIVNLFIVIFKKKYYFYIFYNYILINFYLLMLQHEEYMIPELYITTIFYSIIIFYKKILILLILLSIITMLFLARFYDIYLFDALYGVIFIFAPIVLFIIAIIRLCMYCFKKIRNRLHSKNKVDKNDFFID